MIEILVQVLPDGEELVRVVDERIPEHLLDPRERTIETRTRRPPLLSNSGLNAPPRTEGLARYDRERAKSVADEGGWSGAVVETQERPAPTTTTIPAAAAK
jgi:hypothetical protein